LFLRDMKNGSVVLVVEDDDQTRALLVAVVLRNGMHATQAGDGRSALALLATSRYDAVLLDLLLPELSGVAILAHLIDAKPEMLPRVVVVTAAIGPEWSGSAEAKRARLVIRKPFDVQELERALLLCCAG
jgi:CheY-like chemotaxis protein